MSRKRAGLSDYLDLVWLLEHEFIQQEREQNRKDGLESKGLKNAPVRQLLWWMRKYRHSIKEESTQQMEELLHYIMWFIIIGMFLTGLGTGRALLEYGGENLVNIVSFFVVLVMVPLLFSLVSLGVLLKSFLFAADRSRIPILIKFLLDLFRHLPLGMQKNPQRLYAHEKLMQSLGMTLLQYGSIALSLGALSALIMTITTEDIAFGWNTTLDISPEMMHRIVAVIALPWSTYLPDAVPSRELIILSQHFRLGGEIAPELIAQAKVLGSWWQFLALSLLVWGVSVRIVLVLFSSWNYHRTVNGLLLSNHNALLLLKYMNESHITTYAQEIERKSDRGEHTDKQPPCHSSTQIAADTLIGWNLNADALETVSKQRHIKAGTFFSAGGKNTLEEDDAIIEKAKGSITVVVKAWEPPMREFLDFLRDLGRHSAGIVSVYPVGSTQQNYQANRSDIEIWKMKITSLHQQNIGISREAF